MKGSDNWYCLLLQADKPKMQLTKSSINLSSEKLAEVKKNKINFQFSGPKHPGEEIEQSPGIANKRCSFTGYEPKLLIFCKIFCDPKNNLRSSKSFPDLYQCQNLTQKIVLKELTELTSLDNESSQIHS